MPADQGEWTQVPIRRTTKERVGSFGQFQESYDGIINRALDALEKQKGSKK